MILKEESITDYTKYQGEPQPSFTYVGNGNSQHYYKVLNTGAWPQLATWTMETWLKSGATNTRKVILFQNVGGLNPFSVWIDSVGKIITLTYDGTNYAFEHSQLPVEQWYHIAVVSTPYYAAIRGAFTDDVGPEIKKTYRLNGYQIGSGTIINSRYAGVILALIVANSKYAALSALI